jgi:hypothetical protein
VKPGAWPSSSIGLFAAALSVATFASGCGNNSFFTPVGKQHKPIAVIDAPAGPLDAFAVTVADGSASHDPDGTVVAWHWTLTALPTNSRMTLDPIATATPTAGEKISFRPDLLGAYEIQLVVTDNSGLDSDPAIYDFSAADNSALRLELTWDRDITDVDLHLVDESAGGSFFTSPNDCYFQNKTPDWGVPGVTDDDPVLPFDQDEGFGPEVIGVRAPAAGTYHVFSHYYCDDGFGGTTATVKVYVHGALAAETNATLIHTGDLWDVGTLVFDSAGGAVLSVSSAGVATSTHGCE